MKIGILTFHDGPNHGAFLQAWATCRKLEREGHNVEIINYKNPLHHEKEKGGGFRGFVRNPIYAYGQWRKRRVFASARSAFQLSPFVSSVSAVSRLHYDTVVIGSDVVWNYELFGYDPVFFGALNASRKIAFSASFGSVPRSAQHPERMSSDLAQLDCIAVRDRNSQDIVESMLGVEPVATLDPTLVYDFAEDLNCGSTLGDFAKYLVVYSYRHTAGFIEAVRARAREEGLKIICVGYPPPLRAPRYCSSVDIKIGPFEWIQLFANARVIATSTFHGVVFSIKSKKPFIYIANDKAHNRVSSLLEVCGIAHELKLGAEGKIHSFYPDYHDVNTRLSTLIEFSSRWLIDNV